MAYRTKLYLQAILQSSIGVYFHRRAVASCLILFRRMNSPPFFLVTFLFHSRKTYWRLQQDARQLADNAKSRINGAGMIGTVDVFRLCFSLLGQAFRLIAIVALQKHLLGINHCVILERKQNAKLHTIVSQRK